MTEIHVPLTCYECCDNTTTIQGHSLIGCNVEMQVFLLDMRIIKDVMPCNTVHPAKHLCQLFLCVTKTHGPLQRKALKEMTPAENICSL